MKMEVQGKPGQPAFRFILRAETKDDRELLSLFERMARDPDRRVALSGSSFEGRLGTTEVRIGFEPRAVPASPGEAPR